MQYLPNDIKARLVTSFASDNTFRRNFLLISEMLPVSINFIAVYSSPATTSRHDIVSMIDTVLESDSFYELIRVINDIDSDFVVRLKDIILETVIYFCGLNSDIINIKRVKENKTIIYHDIKSNDGNIKFTLMDGDNMLGMYYDNPTKFGFDCIEKVLLPVWECKNESN